MSSLFSGVREQSFQVDRGARFAFHAFRSADLIQEDASSSVTQFGPGWDVFFF
ncbi:MAG: hypothetical protein NTV93_16855 [Verrucomicrobia bacterium]|nr:hypothetical protein [Verrucomicrobiota bacterium]